jgi:hypothetical protein
MTDIFAALAAEFPRDAVHWRAQTLAKDGAKALALAYLDARDVMDRLDSVCTPAGWRNSVTETPKGRLIATIEIKIGDEWVGKTDGAGDTAVEGEKGGISDSLKRAAVLWGIGRYLYRMESVWAPCEVSEWNGKKQWKAWKGSPWDHVRGSKAPAAQKAAKNAPADPAATIADEARDWIADKLAARQLHVGDLCAAMNVASLKALTYGQMDAVKEWIRTNMKEAA